MPVLSKCELAIIQPMRVEAGSTILITKLIHSSGEFLQSEMILPPHADPQKYGSLITYYKRYQLQAMLGISTADEDDDANMASKQPPKQTANNSDPITEAQLKAISAICYKKNLPKPDLKTSGQAYMWISEQNKKGN
jgi:hypothetical protein